MFNLVQAGEGARVMVDPQKLARFFQQLNTIQAKIASLQAERVANAQREQKLEVNRLPARSAVCFPLGYTTCMFQLARKKD